MEDPQGRTDFFKETAKRLLRFEDEIERSSYIKTIAGTYQVEPEELRKMVNRLAMKGVGMTESEDIRCHFFALFCFSINFLE